MITSCKCNEIAFEWFASSLSSYQHRTLELFHGSQSCTDSKRQHSRCHSFLPFRFLSGVRRGALEIALYFPFMLFNGLASVLPLEMRSTVRGVRLSRSRIKRRPFSGRNQSQERYRRDFRRVCQRSRPIAKHVAELGSGTAVVGSKVTVNGPLCVKVFIPLLRLPKTLKLNS